ncbi:MAG: ATP-dependent DNA ligase [Deltaproteobacteria bacterium]|nr:ATP-dependent DNA ligase [Deltaproteobacteria bacterium]
MELPIRPPYAPMEALLVDEIPSGKEWQYEPKWDGFRCIAFKDGEEIELQSKNGQSLRRYFPELISALQGIRAKKFVIDGEIVIPADGTFSFDDLLQRIHPAESRIKKLSKEHPAKLIVFDLLVSADGSSLAAIALHERRRALERFFSESVAQNESIELSPATTRIKDAERWLQMAGRDLDGIIAKRRDLSYRSGERTGMQKVKRLRTADCVVGGFRYASKGRAVGSLLLGLYDDGGLLHHVGFTSGFSQHERKSLLEKLEALISPPGFTGNAPGGPSRWSTERSTEWQPLKPKLVVEVQYDHFTGNRFRHGTKLLRWRPDKSPKSCSMDQVKPVAKPISPKLPKAFLP